MSFSVEWSKAAAKQLLKIPKNSGSSSCPGSKTI